MPRKKIKYHRFNFEWATMCLQIPPHCVRCTFYCAHCALCIAHLHNAIALCIVKVQPQCSVMLCSVTNYFLCIVPSPHNPQPMSDQTKLAFLLHFFFSFHFQFHKEATKRKVQIISPTSRCALPKRQAAFANCLSQYIWITFANYFPPHGSS